MQPGDVEPYYRRYREEHRAPKGRRSKLANIVDRKRGTHNLREYVRRAELPTMGLGESIAKVPSLDHRSHAIHLSVGFAHWRILQYMEPLYPAELDEDILSCACSYTVEQTISKADSPISHDCSHTDRACHCSRTRFYFR